MLSKMDVIVYEGETAQEKEAPWLIFCLGLHWVLNDERIKF